MLIQDNEQTGHRNIEVLLHDMHGEYTGNFADIPMFKNGQSDNVVRVQLVWDHYALEGVAANLGQLTNITAFPAAYGEQQAEKAYRALFTDSLDEWLYGEMPNALWLVSGTPKGLERAFDHLAAALDVEDGVSGDDDAFDYWPNTMDMLWDFALDLDALKKNDLHTRYVRDIAQRVFNRTVSRSSHRDQQDQKELFLGEWKNDRWAANLG